MSLVPLIAQRLRELRARHGLTQEEAAEAIGLTMRFYQVLESGRKKQVWLETVERLAESFGLQTWEFLGPTLPDKTALQRSPAKSNIHYKVRRGAYRKEKPVPNAPA